MQPLSLTITLGSTSCAAFVINCQLVINLLILRQSLSICYQPVLLLSFTVTSWSIYSSFVIHNHLVFNLQIKKLLSWYFKLSLTCIALIIQFLDPVQDLYGIRIRWVAEFGTGSDFGIRIWIYVHKKCFDLGVKKSLKKLWKVLFFRFSWHKDNKILTA